MESIAAPDGAPYDTYIAGESGKGKPGLLIFTPIFGVDGDMVEIAGEWAQAGFLVAVPDYYFRVAPGVLDRSDEGRKLGFARWEKLDVDRAIDDMRPLVTRLKSSPAGNGKWGALGFCAGGELAFLASTRLGAEVVAGCHATHIHKHLDEAAQGRGAISLHYGGADALVPMEQVRAVQSALAANPHAEVEVYEGAPHGFSFRQRPSYHEVTATRSSARARHLMEGLK